MKLRNWLLLVLHVGMLAGAFAAGPATPKPFDPVTTGFELEGKHQLVASKSCHVVGEQLAGIGNNFSREYFMEGLEHMLDGTNMTTLFPRTALGPQQRYLSRGAYIVESAIGAGPANATWVDM